MKWLYLVIAAAWLLPMTAQERISTSEELGMVHWYRDYDEALAEATAQSKPVFILFQEVPGCSTCRNYGHNVLSHPLVVEAIEQHFVPLAIYNNKGGADKVILDKYQEPTWNNPVVRIVDASGSDIHRRIAGDYSAAAVLQAIITVLAEAGITTPPYLSIANQELAADLETSYYQMYCFWSGEKTLGEINGIVDVESGFMGGAEVVKVTYDKGQTSSKKINRIATSHSIKPVKKSDNYRVANKDVHYYLRNSDYRYLPLSTMQQTKINSTLGSGGEATSSLSPTQVRWLKDIKTGKLSRELRYHQDFATAWWQLDNEASK